MTYHNPVLLKECIEGLKIRPDGVYVDVTFGGGGHSRKILEQLGDKGKLIAFDQDKEAMKNIPDDKRILFINQNFMYLQNSLRMHGIAKVDGILADLGVSSHQFDTGERGFSIRFEGALDMRMNQQATLTAANVVNEYDGMALSKIFRLYGEIENFRRLSDTIVNARTENPIETTLQLKEIITPVAPKHAEHKYFARVFQALRIEVNKEMEVLEEFLKQSLNVLNNEGRLVVISYHSLEDRLVKNFIKSGNTEGAIEKDFFGKITRPFELINKKPIVPGEEEINENNRARSAKLRIAEKI
ncbi:MAG: rsmH [Bacteroidetes bacterium]|jgi:16S rRNA (cytosine1402-N4)-methyltransferase|nr:rsmH [Bacteroidota bacterium]